MKKVMQLLGGCLPILLFSCRQHWELPAMEPAATLSANTTLQEVRKLHFRGNVEKIIDDWVIEGRVVANDRTDNFYKTLVIQDATGGISVKLDATDLYLTYPEGMQVFIRLKGCWLGDYGGLLQLGAGVDRSDSVYPRLIPIPLPLFNQIMVKGKIDHAITPKEVSIQQLSDSLQNCLITIPQVEFIASDTSRPWADVNNQQAINHVITACNQGSIYVRTSGYAKFASAKTPRGNGSITGIYTVFGWEKQLILRDTSDVRMIGLRCSGSGYRTLLWEDFDLLSPGSILSISGWKNIPETGAQHFYVKATSKEKFAAIDAFACSQPRVVTWLISPAIPLSGTSGARLSFDTRDGFDNGATLRVFISTNYDGSNVPARSKWTELPATIAQGSVGVQSSQWKNSGNISLSGYKGTCWIAFKYEGSDTGIVRKTTGFQIDRVTVLSN